VNDAKILQLEAQAAKLIEEAGGVRTGQQLEGLKALTEGLKSRQDMVTKQLEFMMKMAKETGGEEDGKGEPGGVQQLAGTPSNASSAGAPSSGARAGNGAMG
jgi:hypothetical protein